MSKLFRILLLFLVLTGVGIGWFVGIEQWPLVDAIYITVITLTTVGFSEVRSPLEARTKLFLAFYLIASVGIFMYGAFQLGEVLIRAELADWWRKRNMDQERKALEQHYIVCGCGRMGQMLYQQLAESKLPFVAIDRDPDVLEICRHNGWPYVQGDASDDRTLLEAGIERARGLATVLTSDADNLYVVLSSKLLSKQIRVIARATDAKGVAKMEKAGADQVVSLYASGAMRMAQLLTHPTLGDFYEIVSTGGIKLDLAEIHVAPSASFAGQTLADTDFRQRGILVMGICKADGQVLFPPPASTMIDAGDNLFALGDANAIQQLTLDDQDSRIRGTRIEI